MQEMLDGLSRGRLLAGSNFLFADSQFQSLKLSFIVVSTVPAVLAGVVVALWLTNTTLNLSWARG
jgi:multidrug efflux pump subunit AcrB